MKKVLLGVALLTSVSSFAECGSLDEVFENAHANGFVSRVEVGKVLDCHMKELDSALPWGRAFCHTRVGLKKDVLQEMANTLGNDNVQEKLKEYNKNIEQLRKLEVSCPE
ncbi:hypothetical protein HBN50_11090 [Halobacteriovorax sp. GB3]|uniref:hypothetical protein n=1 Tax=Halobacteriovorax sp. GB3 TaxID=2719615 RepID=UPI0023629E12|nr:hypothetical protein [Halobacteriovorax sp. GB3]MDD0853648.1 hypothetical protein [Halobacteriovorax sp. GB3]